MNSSKSLIQKKNSSKSEITLNITSHTHINYTYL